MLQWICTADWNKIANSAIVSIFIFNNALANLFIHHCEEVALRESQSFPNGVWTFQIRWKLLLEKKIYFSRDYFDFKFCWNIKTIYTKIACVCVFSISIYRFEQRGPVHNSEWNDNLVPFKIRIFFYPVKSFVKFAFCLPFRCEENPCAWCTWNFLSAPDS